jgi:hypothetical protein
MKKISNAARAGCKYLMSALPMLIDPQRQLRFGARHQTFSLRSSASVKRVRYGVCFLLFVLSFITLTTSAHAAAGPEDYGFNILQRIFDMLVQFFGALLDQLAEFVERLMGTGGR